jgi:hypothetical protein
MKANGKRSLGEVVLLRKKIALTADKLKHNAHWYRGQA